MTVLVTFDFPPAHGGIQRYAAELARALVALGTPVVVVAPGMDGDAAHDAAFPAPVVRFRGRSRLGRIVAALRATSAARRAGGGGTIAMSWFPAGLVAALVPRSRRGHLTVLVHGTEIAARPRSLRALVRRFVLARADRVVAQSTFTAGITRTACGRDAEIVYVGVEPRVVAREPAAVPTALFVGRLVARKGADRAIEAMARVRAQHPGARLEIVGDGPDRARLEALAAQAGLADAVRFHGALDDAARDAAFARAWCFVMPSRAEGTDVEGFGIVYLEAAVAGLPAIGGRGSGADDAIVHETTGLLVDGRDAGAVASAMLRMFDDPTRTRAMGDAARRRALDEFTWERTARALMSTPS